MRRRIILGCLLGTLCRAGWAQVLPAGSEFQVNTYITGQQNFPSVASDANANFVVVWTSYDQDGDGFGIRWRKFNAAGVSQAAGGANSYTTGSQVDPAVASDAAGNFVVVWESDGQDGDRGGIFGRRFDASGTPLGAEFKANAHTMNVQGNPRVAAAPSGNFVVVWESFGQDGDYSGVFGRLFDSVGTPIAGFRANTYTTGNQAMPAVASDANGNFVVVWEGADGSYTGIVGRRFDASGSPIGGEFPVNSYTTNLQTLPAIASEPSGSFVVVWKSRSQDGSGYGIFGRRFNAFGVAQGSDFQINTYTTIGQDRPSVTSDAKGNFVVTWQSGLQDGSSYGIFGQRFNASGAPQGSEFQVNSYTSGAQLHASVASSADGDFVVVWDSDGEDGSFQGIFGQRYGDLIFEDDFESGDVSRWSSSVTDGTDLAVTAGAALAGTAHGLRALVNDTNSLYVQDDTPSNEGRYRARLYFDPNGFDPGEADAHFRVRIFIAFDAFSQRAITLVLKRQGGQYSVEGRARLNDGNRADTGFFDITNAPHFVEFDWQRATGSGNSDGYFALLIDNVTVAFLPGLDNDLSSVDSARMGALSIKTGATGTLRFDQFESRRQNLIGPE